MTEKSRAKRVLLPPRKPAWWPERWDTPTAQISDTKVVFSAAEKSAIRRQPPMAPSVWAEKHRVVAVGPFAGSKWRNEVAPYLAGIMDASFAPGVEEIVIDAVPQVGKSALLDTCLGYLADRDPGDVMIVYPDKITAGDNCRDRITPAIMASPRLRGLMTGIEDDKSSLRIKLRTMVINMAWSGSPTSTANKSIRYLFLDEVDKYEKTAGKDEAGIIEYIEKRTRAFKHGKKIWKVSSPTTENNHIWKAYQACDVTYSYTATCPTCGQRQIMRFGDGQSAGGVKWPKIYGDDGNVLPNKDLASVVRSENLGFYECEKCLAEWSDYVRDQAIQPRCWVSDKDGKTLEESLLSDRPRSIGFKIPAWISTFVSLSEIAASFILAQTDKERLKDFNNGYAAEPWRVVVTQATEGKIMAARSKAKPQMVPESAVLLTAGLDPQAHGIWFVVRAWARDYTSWLIHYGHLSDWSDIEELLFQNAYPVEGADRAMKIRRAGIDTGGGRDAEQGSTMTERAYLWLQKHMHNRDCRIWGVKGSSSHGGARVQVGKPLTKTPSGKPIPGGLRLLSLDTHEFKDIFHYRLAAAAEGYDMPAYLHASTGQDYIRQILAEEKRETKTGAEWVKLRNDNHYLDCEVYAMAAADPEWPGGGLQLKTQPANSGRRILSPGIKL